MTVTPSSQAVPERVPHERSYRKPATRQGMRGEEWWAAQAPHRVEPRTLQIIGVPLDLGASMRGVDLGPTALRVAGLVARLTSLGHTVVDAGNITVPDRTRLLHDARMEGFLPAITGVCRELAAETAAVVEDGRVPVVIGGDHSLVAGSCAGPARALAARGEALGYLHLDTHPDSNTITTSPSGNVHGMPVAALLGDNVPGLDSIAGDRPALRAEHVAMVGIRDIDAGELENLRRWGVRVFTMREIDERGLRAVMEDALEIVTTGTGGFHVSLDVDWVDPTIAPGVGTPVPGGATYREAHLAMEMIYDSGRMLSLDLVEVNPLLDERNQTAELAVGLVASAFGARTL